MEPLDPAKNDECSGFSRRRISSILKAPRKSIIFPDAQQQENVVECAKLVEKRISRRVSFAPANDVLLFSKDVKNSSPVRSPLQELITTTATVTQNGHNDSWNWSSIEGEHCNQQLRKTSSKGKVQVVAGEDGIQQIMGMETLLNAPLHASQQRDKVNFDTGDDLGEKTVMFSTDDAFMDMTHSHTINIANDAESPADISVQNDDSLPTRGEKAVMFTANDVSTGMRNVSSSAPSLDSGFENFLASLSKPSGSSVNPVITRMTSASGASSEETTNSLAQIKTQRADVDKENLAPASVSAVMEKSVNTSRKIGELSYGSVLCPEDDLSMDMTEARTDGILGLTEDDDPFQCLFPTQEMYSHLDNRVSQTAEKTTQQQISKPLASFNTKDMTSLKNPLLASQQRHKVNLDPKDECRNKTILFTADGELMDMTQSHTVNIASGSLDLPNQNLDIFHTHGKRDNASFLEERKRETCAPPPGSLAKGLDLGFKNFLSSLSEPGASSSKPAIAKTAASSKETVDTRRALSQLKSNVDKEKQSLNTTRSIGGSFNGGTICPENDENMDMTEAETGRITGITGSDDPFQFLFPTQDMYPRCESLKKQEMISSQKKSEVLGSSNHSGMETLLKPTLKTKVQRNLVKFNTEDDCGDKTVRFSADDACMDVTRSHTINIAADFELQLPQNVDFLPTCGEKTVRFDAAMDMTQCLTVNIASNVVSDSVFPMKKQEAETCGLPRNRYSSACSLDPNLNTTLSKPNGPSVNPVIAGKMSTAAQSSNTEDSWDEGTICPEDDVSMEMTEAQTGRILGCTGTDKPLQCLFPTQDMNPQRGCLRKAEMTSRQQPTEAQGSSNRKGMETSLAASLKTNVQRHQVMFDAEDDYREKTVRFTADDAGMDVTRSHTVNIATNFDLQSHQNVDFIPACGEKTVRFTADDDGMDVTRSHTVNIATDLQPQSHQNVDILPAGGEKTVRFTADDAGMDVTRSHTVNIATNFGPQSHQNVDILPACGEKTVRFTADDAGMDVTRSHTVNIATNFGPQFHQNVGILPACGEKTVRFTADDDGMDVTRSHTVNISTDLQLQSHQNVDILPACGEKTVRFTADDAGMDVTRSHTVNIATNFGPQFHQNVDILPACGEKTVRFTADDDGMDVTRSHTVNIAADLQLQSHQNVDILHACGEKTVKFTADDAGMDVTRSHTVHIATNFEPQSHQNADFLPACGEKTVRFTATDAAMDVTRSHTVNIASNFEPQSHRNMDLLPACGEKTVRFTATDAAMDMTQCLTVNIASNSVSDSLLPHRESDISSTHAETTHRPCRNHSSSAQALDQGFKNSLSRASSPWANPELNKAVAAAAPSPQETEDINGFLHQRKTQKHDLDTEKEGFVSDVMEKPVNKTMTEGPEDDVSMGITEAQTGPILGQTYRDEPPQCLSSMQDLYPNSDHLKKTKVPSQESRDAVGSSNPDGVEITNFPDSLDSNEAGIKKELRNQTVSQTIESSPSAVEHDVDAAPSRKSRRRSLANLQSKVKRLSHIISTAPETVAMDSCTAPLPPLEHDMDKISNNETKSLPVTEPELEMGLVNTEENTQCLMQGDQPSTTTATPFNLKTKQLMSRLSVGSFKAKLPQRSKPDDPKKVNSVREHTTVNVTKQVSNFDDDLSNIYDEELGSYEEMSETLDISPQKATEEVSTSPEFNMDEHFEEDVFEQDFISAVHGKKRPLPVDENIMEDEKRMKTSTEVTTDIETSHVVECDSNTTAAPGMMTQSTDYSSSSHTARYEATFESTFKQSMCEDYASDIQRKLDDGTITVLEFFKLFNIDFVIHNPRQSILPGRLLSDTDCTPMDLLKDRYINRPKQMVYEKDVLNLTEKVEGLKERMGDLDKPLKIVNRPLWEEVRFFSEKELTSFGAKLKERNSLFRKSSKVQSHEMKEVLYSNLVQANLKEQQRLRETIEEADVMMKNLDDCICELETELAAVEEKGFEDKPSLKSRQEEMQKVTEALADNDRQISELEIQKKQNSNKLNRLKVETRNLESHVAVLNMVNEWKFAETRDNCTVYTFLHETLHLQLVYEKSKGNNADNQSDRKISHITFKLQLDDEKSQGHARLAHKLLSQYIDGESDWVEKYPTSRHVPQLLHDVGLVVSRCRLLGEELRLLKMWGGMRLDILNISCVDTQVHIVFSRLKIFSKFEVVFSVSLIDRLCVLQVQNFKNMIGNTTIQQIEEIVASFSPAKNLLTKIVKKIHENLLC